MLYLYGLVAKLYKETSLLKDYVPSSDIKDTQGKT